MATRHELTRQGAEAQPSDFEVGCFHIQDVRGRPTIGWAVLKPNGDICSGSIIIREVPAFHPDAEALNKAGLRRAALLLNKRLATVMLDKANCYGEPPENAFYRRAGVQPTWHWFGTRRSALLETLTVEISPGLGLRPMIPFDSKDNPEDQAIADMKDFSNLRSLVSRLRSHLPPSQGSGLFPAQS
ncbi:hypothetical protein KZ820_16440 [Sphingomonas sp. RRHST34]|uniref:N-acetyltransferase domain-containing protein n=1 Tax=Sphingomonas citri TaxID=2862499 RepID=A0ABS7BS65_9SPHN|nr:hypothetical protein [Sphingomonas citri]MBW6532332.1 hypothetical protein [Sphingomonas citri]